MQDLDDFMVAAPPAGVVVETEDDTTERFRLTDDASANWAMRKLRAAEVRKAQNQAIAAQEIARVNAWLAEVNAPIDRDVNFFTGVLVEYAALCRANPDDGRKTLSLPAGKVSSRAPSPRWTIDAERFLPWARENAPDLVRVKEEPNLSAIKARYEAADERAVTDDGEIVPGVVVVLGDPTYTVNPDLS